MRFDSLYAPSQFDMQHVTSGNTVIAAKRALELRIKLLDFDGCEEAQAAQIHGEKRKIAASIGLQGRARGREQSSIAAEHHQELGMGRHLIARELRSSAGVDCGFFVQ